MPAAKKPAKKTSGGKVASSKSSAKVKKIIAKVKPAAKKVPVKKTKTVTAALKKTAKKPTPKPATKTVAKATAKTPAKTSVSSKQTVEAKPSKKIATPKVPDVFRCPISGIPVKAEKPNLSDKTLAKLKELLTEERVRHLAQADELIQEAVDMITDREAGDTQFDEESGEGDSVAVERERTLFLAAEANNTVAQIDRALARMKSNTYGLCVPSGRRISVPRLEALPWTEVCVDCKARSERRR